MDAIFQAARLSLIVGFGSAILAVPLALLISTLLFRSRWRPLEVFFLIPLFLPPTLTGFVLLWLLSPLRSFGTLTQSYLGGIVFTPAGTILACFVVSFPLAYQACIVGMARIHKELPESGSVLGGTKAFNTLRIIWPQMTEALIVAILLVFARAVGEFGASMMVGGNIAGYTQTLSLAIFSHTQSGHYDLAGWAALFSLMLGLGVYLFLRYLEAQLR